MVWFGMDLKADSVPPPAMGRDAFHWTGLVQAVSNLEWSFPGFTCILQLFGQCSLLPLISHRESDLPVKDVTGDASLHC